MSKKYNTVKNYYDSGLWSERKVYDAVGRWITADEYELIVGMPYPVGR